MRQFSTVELAQKIGSVTHAASREPVSITQHRKARFVLMSIEDYERLRRGADTREAGTLETMPDTLFEEVETAFARYGRDGGEA